MPKRIYVGNLPATASEADVSKLVSGSGRVEAVEFTRDKSRDSAMATITFAGDGPKTVDDIDGQRFGGRVIKASSDRAVVINHEEQ